jgi:hypothetical protein
LLENFLGWGEASYACDGVRLPTPVMG